MPQARVLVGMSPRVTVSDLSTVTPHPAATDFDGTTSLYFGSAIMHGAVLPGKVVEMRTRQVLQDDAVECTIGFSIPFPLVRTWNSCQPHAVSFLMEGILRKETVMNREGSCTTPCSMPSGDNFRGCAPNAR